MGDKTIKLLGSTIQHGKDSDRVYIMKLKDENISELLLETESIAETNDYGKIIAKVSGKFEGDFNYRGYRTEARVPNFYSGREDGIFISKFLSQARKSDGEKEEIDEIIDIARSKEKVRAFDDLDSSYEMRVCKESDSQDMANLYSRVFESYPFPIFDPDYIVQTMRDNVCYYGIWHNGKLVSLASSEMDEKNKNTEMTDFATDQNYRGKSLPLRLLFIMEEDMKKRGIVTAYTIARAKIPGINIVFGKADYSYGGTLIKNTGIGGSIESMNIWYKALKSE